MRPPHGLPGGFSRGAPHHAFRGRHGPQALREHRLHRGPDRRDHGSLRGRLRLLQLRHEAAKTVLGYICGPRGLRTVSKPAKRPTEKTEKETKASEAKREGAAGTAS